MSCFAVQTALDTPAMTVNSPRPKGERFCRRESIGMVRHSWTTASRRERRAITAGGSCRRVDRGQREHLLAGELDVVVRAVGLGALELEDPAGQPPPLVKLLLQRRDDRAFEFEVLVVPVPVLAVRAGAAAVHRVAQFVLEVVLVVALLELVSGQRRLVLERPPVLDDRDVGGRTASRRGR